MEQQTGSKLGKEYGKAECCHTPYLTSMQSTLCEMLGWMKHKLESRLLEEISTTLICRLYHSNSRKWRGTKEPLDEGERGEWKSWLKTQHSKKTTTATTKIKAFIPITSWQIEGGKVEAVTDFIFLGSKIAADGDCSHEIKRHLILERKAIQN